MSDPSPTDSGINEPNSGQLTPHTSNSQMNINARDDGDDDFEDLDETLTERLIGLTEMFPQSVRNGFVFATKGSVNGFKQLYGFSRSALWVVFTSSVVLLAPLALEMERSQLDEMSKQQQRQILLGPSAALSGGGGGHGLPMPPLSPPAK